MAEKKNTNFKRPGGYAQPKGAIAVQKRAAKEITQAEIKLFGDSVPAWKEVRGQKSEISEKRSNRQIAKSPDRQIIQPAYHAADPDTRLYIGDCREVLANLPDKGNVDLIFADPPFNWEVPYAGDEGTRHKALGISKGEDRLDKNSSAKCLMPNASLGWNDAMPRAEYERFTFDWLDGCIECLAPHGSLWVNIPDDTAAEVVLHLKRRGLTMINWCIWHFRFGQNRNSSFIMSKVHALYFAKLGTRHWAIGTSEGTEAGRQEGTKASNNGATHTSAQCLMPSALPDRIWNPNEILELSDRASIYADPRTMNKESNKGLRVPMDVWYGKYWGRIQGNNKERRHNHHNQIPEIYLERVIKACSNPGSLVLDPFCGSGTTSTVARALGRRSITIEYSSVNAKSAWERIIDVGMIPREDAGKPQSTAIFKSRRKRSIANV